VAKCLESAAIIIAWSRLPAVSLIECIDRRGAPTSTVAIPVRAAETGPMVEPGAMSALVMNFWQGTPAASQSLRNLASESASVA
jgi:hypothetical protein